jgi:hypothetical protein
MWQGMTLLNCQLSQIESTQSHTVRGTCKRWRSTRGGEKLNRRWGVQGHTRQGQFSIRLAAFGSNQITFDHIRSDQIRSEHTTHLGVYEGLHHGPHQQAVADGFERLLRGQQVCAWAGRTKGGG